MVFGCICCRVYLFKFNFINLPPQFLFPLPLIHTTHKRDYLFVHTVQCICARSRFCLYRFFFYLLHFIFNSALQCGVIDVKMLPALAMNWHKVICADELLIFFCKGCFLMMLFLIADIDSDFLQLRFADG